MSCSFLVHSHFLLSFLISVPKQLVICHLHQRHCTLVNCATCMETVPIKFNVAICCRAFLLVNIHWIITKRDWLVMVNFATTYFFTYVVLCNNHDPEVLTYSQNIQLNIIFIVQEVNSNSRQSLCYSCIFVKSK